MSEMALQLLVGTALVDKDFGDKLTREGVLVESKLPRPLDRGETELVLVVCSVARCVEPERQLQAFAQILVNELDLTLPTRPKSR